jgi:hypothetical protein
LSCSLSLRLDVPVLTVGSNQGRTVRWSAVRLVALFPPYLQKDHNSKKTGMLHIRSHLQCDQLQCIPYCIAVHPLDFVASVRLLCVHATRPHVVIAHCGCPWIRFDLFDCRPPMLYMVFLVHQRCVSEVPNHPQQEETPVSRPEQS